MAIKYWIRDKLGRVQRRRIKRSNLLKNYQKEKDKVRIKGRLRTVWEKVSGVFEYHFFVNANIKLKGKSSRGTQIRGALEFEKFITVLDEKSIGKVYLDDFKRIIKSLDPKNSGLFTYSIGFSGKKPHIGVKREGSTTVDSAEYVLMTEDKELFSEKTTFKHTV